MENGDGRMEKKEERRALRNTMNILYECGFVVDNSKGKESERPCEFRESPLS